MNSERGAKSGNAVQPHRREAEATDSRIAFSVGPARELIGFAHATPCGPHGKFQSSAEKKTGEEKTSQEKASQEKTGGKNRRVRQRATEFEVRVFQVRRIGGPFRKRPAGRELAEIGAAECGRSRQCERATHEQLF